MSTQNSANPFTRPVYPPLQPSASSQASAFQSYSSTSSLASQSPASSAPLPSPSSTHSQHQGFFGSLHAQQPPQQQRQSQAATQRQSAQRQSSYEYQSNRQGAGSTAAETNNYLNEYALLAEAAKRAQIAVVMRDIEGMEL
ncbi:hypothetical protein K505DRAFT_357654 [Melanomma pulvis-pyrius CBS 109.77]|uniref:Uncharacterized protein n=1 Tax=Melanomma pulvis-pyrius CBS 109.77 TaxID=1314802 RepID=A0A6A6XPD0_9PLEO|nr:hypothetical protein K505DRAFT_357654 [Melanomma pulvis-pyrius CBS 109.77]